ncbi:MAG: CopD family protein [Isosphaeraceae bacterium]
MALLIALHVLAVVTWVGGMFFAYVVLRPSAGALPSETRLALWQAVFRRFFPWVWSSIVVLLLSGYGMIFLSFGGFAGAGLYIHIMQGLGIVMMMLFLHLFFVPWRRFSDAVEKKRFPEAAQHLAQIRRIVAANLVLGLLTIIVGASGRFW